MGHIQSAPAVRPLAGLLSSDPALLRQAVSSLSDLLGKPVQLTDPAPFGHTHYYEREMGADLLRQFVVFGSLKDPDELADWKLAANDLEQRLGLHASGGRRVNVDPGYLAPGKLVLASTKDHSHRVYLRQGIYAEVTLRYQDNRFKTWEWSYPDYAQAAEFFQQAYKQYRADLAAAGGRSQP